MFARHRIAFLSTNFVAFSTTKLYSFAEESHGAKPLLKSQLPKIVLYQYKICPFCNRVKAYLDYLQIEYSTIEVNPLTKSEISFSKDHKKVPIVKFDNEIIVESSEIINKISTDLVEPNSAFFTPDTNQWSEWSEKKLAVMLYPNITRNFSESWECFNYVNKVDSWNYPTQVLTQTAGTIAMSFANGRIKKKYGIVNEREELKKELENWTNALGNKNFLHGETLTMPDIMVFGVLRSIKGLKTFDEIMSDPAHVNLLNWYQRVESQIKP